MVWSVFLLNFDGVWNRLLANRKNSWLREISGGSHIDHLILDIWLRVHNSILKLVVGANRLLRGPPLNLNILVETFKLVVMDVESINQVPLFPLLLGIRYPPYRVQLTLGQHTIISRYVLSLTGLNTAPLSLHPDTCLSSLWTLVK